MELMIADQYGKEKVMDNVNRNFLLTVMMCLAFLFAVGNAYAWEENTDRPGLNYKDFDLRAAEPKLCEDACIKETACRAWTYVKPGIQSRSARCWLKKEVPPAKINRCCVSGTVRKPPEPVSGQTSQPSVNPSCPQLSFTTTSPLPPAVIGGDYTVQIQTTGGKPPISFCPTPEYDKVGNPSPTCDNKSMILPIGLTMSTTGLISGQLVCQGIGANMLCPKAGYTFFAVLASDSCGQKITKRFYIDIKAAP